ncbi:hypothetical protein V2J09_016793 [Rumex salicifolius]
MDASRVLAFVVPMLVLLWIIYTGYKFVTETQGSVLELEYIDIRYAIVLGALTVAFGLFSFILGLSLVAKLALAFLARSEDDSKASSIQETEQKKFSQSLMRSSVTTISVFMLIWTTYYGFKLANEPLKEGKLHCLSFLVGVIAIAFGLTNFLIGIAILADCMKSLPAHLQEKLVRYNAYEDNMLNAEIEV